MSYSSRVATIHTWKCDFCKDAIHREDSGNLPDGWKKVGNFHRCLYCQIVLNIKIGDAKRRVKYWENKVQLAETEGAKLQAQNKLSLQKETLARLLH